ncbi:hypothetical protein GS682_33075 [Nostoc sp. B(2019)]|nr:hypothetical protein [Nostoc sp. B(2019)]
MSNDKLLCIYALFLRFSARRSLTLPQQAIALYNYLHQRFPSATLKL